MAPPLRVVTFDIGGFILINVGILDVGILDGLTVGSRLITDGTTSGVGGDCVGDVGGN